MSPARPPRPRPRTDQPAPRTVGARPAGTSATGAAAPPATIAPTRAAAPARTPQDAVDGSFTPTVSTYTAGRGGVRTAPVVSPRSAERFAERVRARRALARRKVAAVAAAVLGLAALVWLVGFSSVLALDVADVEVEGTGTVVAVDQVQAVVAPLDGVPLPRLDTVRLRDAVLDVPGVREARVTRVWPHGLLVAVVSREPVAAVPETAPGQGFALLDEEGVQVGRVDAAPDGLPVVDVPVGEARTLRAVLAVLDGVPDDLLAQVGAVSATSEDMVTMQLRDGVTVVWGSADATALKARVLATLRASAQAAGATTFDVSAPTRPITK